MNEFTIYEVELEVIISLLDLIMIIIGAITPFASAFTIFKYKPQVLAILCKKKY